jgi:ribosome-associated toxin RatA of RatAB toxin-antitoxin module
MYKIFLLLPILLICYAAPAQDEWKFNTEKEGIKVYTNIASASKVKPIKVECVFNATVSQLVAVLMDIKAYTEWVYKTKSAALVKQISPSELYYYAELDMPWPAQDRDFVAHVMITQNSDTKVITVDAPEVPGFIPEKDGLLRMQKSKGRWTITPTGNNQVKVVYVLHIDPDGPAPAWLINMLASDGPLQSFKKLKVQLQKPAYKNISLPFIRN